MRGRPVADRSPQTRLTAPVGPDERAGYRATFPALVRRLEALGFMALDAEANCGEKDSLDFCHLSESGGRKLAVGGGARVRRLARHLGYNREGIPTSSGEQAAAPAILGRPAACPTLAPRRCWREWSVPSWPAAWPAALR